MAQPTQQDYTITNKTQNSDSLEMDFGGVRKSGKVYFDSGNPEDAKQRITNMKEIALHAEKELLDFKAHVEQK